MAQEGDHWYTYICLLPSLFIYFRLSWLVSNAKDTGEVTTFKITCNVPFFDAIVWLVMIVSFDHIEAETPYVTINVHTSNFSQSQQSIFYNIFVFRQMWHTHQWDAFFNISYTITSLIVCSGVEENHRRLCLRDLLCFYERTLKCRRWGHCTPLLLVPLIFVIQFFACDKTNSSGGMGTSFNFSESCKCWKS